MISMIYNLPLSLSQFSLVSNSAVSFHELWKNFTILYSGFCIFIFYLVSITLIPYVCVYYIMGISYAENSFKKLNIMKVIYIHICHFSYHTFVYIGVNLILAPSGLSWELFLIFWMQLYHFLLPSSPSNPLDITPILFQIHSLYSFNCCTCMYACMFACIVHICMYIHS